LQVELDGGKNPGAAAPGWRPRTLRSLTILSSTRRRRPKSSVLATSPPVAPTNSCARPWSI